MHERIKQIIENEGLSVRKFEEIISCSNGVIAKVLKKQTDISVKVLISIKENFPQYSAEWLLTGEGDMYKDCCSSKAESDTGNIEQRLAEIEKKQEIRDKEMERIVETLERISNELTAINEERDKNHHSLCG